MERNVFKIFENLPAGAVVYAHVGDAWNSMDIGKRGVPPEQVPERIRQAVDMLDQGDPLTRPRLFSRWCVPRIEFCEGNLAGLILHIDTDHVLDCPWWFVGMTYAMEPDEDPERGLRRFRAVAEFVKGLTFKEDGS